MDFGHNSRQQSHHRVGTESDVLTRERPETPDTTRPGNFDSTQLLNSVERQYLEDLIKL